MDETNEVKREWSMREYRESDEKQMLELREIAISEKKDSQWWKWMYRDSPAGPALVMLAEAKQKIVGQHAIMPVSLKIGDQVTKGGHGFDLMVHPEYRHQGMFRTLGTELAKSAGARGRSVSYGTPNNQSHPGFVKWLKASDVFEVPLLTKVIAWGTVLKKRFGIPTFAGNLLGNAWERMTNRVSPSPHADVKVEQVSSFNERIDTFWLKASVIKNIMVVKDMKYLNWRYVAKPGKEYKILIAKKQQEIVGYIVLKLEKNGLSRGYIVDLLALPGDDIIAALLITKGIRYFKEQGAVKVSCWMFEETPYYNTLRKLGFVRRPGPFLCARVFDQNIPKEFVTNPANWYYVMGDDDAL
jgi:GNAT superfamily N-acetyltransferase